MIASGAKVAGDNRKTRATDALTDRPAIDEEHLERMTLGDGRLEQEVLQIFVRQTAMMLERISSGKPGAVANGSPHSDRFGARHRRVADRWRRGTARSRQL